MVTLAVLPGMLRTSLVVANLASPGNSSRAINLLVSRPGIVGLVQWAQATQLTLELVYYPPYHSKYNPIERCWGVLEVYWNGELLDSEEAVLGFAANMTYAGRHPHVDRVSAAYCSGVRRSSAEKKLLEGRLMRQPSLPKWSVTIAPPKPDEIILPA